MEGMDNGGPPSARVGDRAAWHLVDCLACDDESGSYCAVGRPLMEVWRQVQRAVAAFDAVPPDQRKLLLEDSMAALEAVPTPP